MRTANTQRRLYRSRTEAAFTLDEVIRRFLVLGKVQGVFFRHSTRLEAQRLAIRGAARNLPDGSVEVLAHGAPSAIEELRLWLHRGPPEARVAEVREVPPDETTAIPEGFATF
jgi:acylphosphatase